MMTTPGATDGDRQKEVLVAVGAEVEYPVSDVASGTGLLVNGHSTCRFCGYSQAAKIADHA